MVIRACRRDACGESNHTAARGSRPMSFAPSPRLQASSAGHEPIAAVGRAIAFTCLDHTGEGVADAVRRANERLSAVVIAKRAPQFLDDAGDGRIGDKRVGPQTAMQLLFRHDARRLFDEEW